jgi:hypothetical protein
MFVSTQQDITCTFFESEIDLRPPVTQERLNRAISRDTGASKATELDFDASDVVSFESADNAGVAVKNLVVDSPSSNMQVYYEYFYLMMASGPHYEELSCQTQKPEGAQEAQTIRAFLGSLRINPETPT